MKLLVSISLCILAVTGKPQYHPQLGYGFPFPRFSKESEVQPTIVPAPNPNPSYPGNEEPIFSISDLITAAEQVEQPQGEQYVEQYICLNVIQIPPKLFGNRNKHNKRPRIVPGIPGHAPWWVDGRQLATDQTSLQFMCANVVTASQISDILDAVKKPATFAPQPATGVLPETPTQIPDRLIKDTEVTTTTATTVDTDARKFPTPYPPAPGKVNIEEESVEIEAAEEKVNPLSYQHDGPLSEKSLSPLGGVHPGLLYPGHPSLYPQVPLPLHQQRIGYIGHQRPVFPGYGGHYY